MIDLNNAEILGGMAEIIEEITGVPAADVQPEKSFLDDLEIDSLSMVEILVAAEERFGVRIPDEDAREFRTVRDAVEYIKKTGIPA